MRRSNRLCRRGPTVPRVRWPEAVERAVRFYRARPDELVLPPAELGELTLSRWSPRRDGIPRGIFAGTTNFAWWAMERLGMFARDGLAVKDLVDQVLLGLFFRVGYFELFSNI